MAVLKSIIQAIINAGAVAILPLFILILGLFFKVKFTKALKSGLLAGIGFKGLQLVVSFLVTTVTPIIKHYSGKGFNIVDVGWETLSAAAWATKFAALIIPIGLVLNFVLIRFKLTKTLNVDIWNYWHLLRHAAILSLVLMAMGITGVPNFAISTAFGVFLSVLICYIGDRIAPWWQKYFGLEGTTCTTVLQTVTTLPIAVVTDKIISKIPGLNKINISYKLLDEKIGGFASPTIIGAILGAFLGIITGQPLTAILQIAVGLAAVITLTPRMVSLFMEGISPISSAARDYMIKKLGPDADFNIGVDIALGVGDQTTITVGVLMIPISIFLAFVLPGNAFFPIAFFGSSLTYAMATVCMITKGNVFRSLLIGIVYMVFTIYAFNYTAALCTQFVVSSGVMQVPAGARVVAGGMNNFIDLLLAALNNLVK